MSYAAAKSVPPEPVEEAPKRDTLHSIMSELIELTVSAEEEVTDEMESKFDALNERLSDKAEAYKKFNSMLEAHAEWHEQQMAKHRTWKNRLESMAKRNKERMLGAMDALNTDKIQTRMGNVSIRETPSVEIPNEEEWVETAPPEYVRTKKEAKANLLISMYRDHLKAAQQAIYDKARDEGKTDKEAKAVVELSKHIARNEAAIKMPDRITIVYSRSVIL